MALIYESENFVVEAADKPHITRTDGGHIRIIHKQRICDRTEMTKEEAVEFMRLTMVVGESFKLGMKKQGIKLLRKNYHDMGNWAFKTGKKPYFHLHLYGRVKDAKYQIFPEALNFPDRSTGFYDEFEPLNAEDIKFIQKQIKIILKKSKYQDKEWGL